MTFSTITSDGVATVTLSRPKRLNALTFDMYNRLGDWFLSLENQRQVRAVVICGEGRAFCSGGDQDDIIAELLGKDMSRLLDFTRTTGRLIQAIRRAPTPVIAATSGACVGAGAVIALAADMRIAAADTKFGFIFPKVGLCGADMGATYLLPRVVGLGHASELLFFGDIITAARALEIGLVNRVTEDRESTLEMAQDWAKKLAAGPQFAHRMTKKMIEDEAVLSLEQAIEAEAQAQAICMQHSDFSSAHTAFKQKQTPQFKKLEDA